MILKNLTLMDFDKKFRDKKVACFGAGNHFQTLCYECIDCNISLDISYLVDNSIKKQGTIYNIEDKEFKIISPKELLDKEIDAIIITTVYYAEIIDQLDKYKELDKVECYVYSLMPILEPRTTEEIISTTNEKLIPKVINYCWFGNGEKSELEKSCIESWKKFCPDYEIIEWNERNYDVEKNEYLKKMYNNKKWAFVSDYARLDILYNFGGIYLDTDVEIIRNVDELLFNKAFVGVEIIGCINSGGGIGSVKGLPILSEIMKEYESLNIDSNHSRFPNSFYETNVFRKYGFKTNNKYQKIFDVSVYPFEYFSPKITGANYIVDFKDTYSIHHYNLSWTSCNDASENPYLAKLLKF